MTPARPSLLRPAPSGSDGDTLSPAFAAFPRDAFLSLRGITRVYPGVRALDDVSLDIGAGEVVGLIGENGAGKSTLMKVLGGVIAPTRGAIEIDGQSFGQLSVQQSFDAGIAFVHQELTAFDNLDVAANVLLGREITGGWPGNWLGRRLKLIDRDAMARAVQPILDRVGARFTPDTPVASLSLAEQQLLEIVKALSMNARLVIMDEPTSSLTLTETNLLLAVIGELKANGISVLFISHRLGEVQSCADRVVVLRDGRVAGQLAKDEIDHDAMIRLMIGRDIMAAGAPHDHAPGAASLQIRGLRTAANPAVAVDLNIHAGEILGLAGLVGAGRTELARAIFGVDPPDSGALKLESRVLERHGPFDSIAAGLYLVPEDRKGCGLILDFSIPQNISLADLSGVSARGLLAAGRERAKAEEQCGRLAIRTTGGRQVAAELSGGNQQKVVLAKWLSMRPRVMIFDEPTRGIDVGAKAEIYRIMRELADEGVAILMISSDMEEVIGVSDRIAVMCRGAITGILERRDFSEQNVIALAVG
jgi:ribose transport system ATP-binding protein